MKQLICLRCGNGADPDKPWIQRGKNPPKACHRCNSPYWDKERMAYPLPSEKPTPSPSKS